MKKDYNKLDNYLVFKLINLSYIKFKSWLMKKGNYFVFFLL